VLKQIVEVTNDCGTASRTWSRITPAFSGAVVPTNGCELRYLSLNHTPAIATVSPTAGFEDYGRAPQSRTVDVQCAAADINPSADTERMMAVAATTDFFIGKADGRCDQQREGESNQGLPQPPIAEQAHVCTRLLAEPGIRTVPTRSGALHQTATIGENAALLA
jgi:hypothetical protein